MSTINKTTNFREIVIVATPRSGSNFFCECLASFSEVDAYLELFNRAGVMGLGSGGSATLAHFSKIAGKPVTSPRDASVIHMFQENPIWALDELRALAQEQGKHVLTYKIFPRQLSAKNLAALWERPNLSAFFLVRKRLDVYISYVKAKMSNVWKGRPTHNILPSLEAGEFRRWALDADKWYNENYDAAINRNIPLRLWSYDDDVDIGKEALLQEIKAQLNHWGISATYDAQNIRTRIQRQDRKAGPFRKISNGEVLRQDLREMKLYNYALEEPLINGR